MSKRVPMLDEQGEVRELTAEDMRRFKPATEVLPASLKKTLGVRGRPRSAHKKVPTNVRYDADVVEAFKATGEGWQTRMNNALREWAAAHGMLG